MSQGTVARISSSLGKIKGALKANQPIEGALYLPEIHNVENDMVEDIIITECSNIFRDLSAWRVSILSYQVGICLTFDLFETHYTFLRRPIRW